MVKTTEPETKKSADRFGHLLVTAFHVAGLFVIGASIAWAAVHAYIDMIKAGGATLDDILLLFIYLELGAMVGIYFKTNKLPVLFLLYIAITAMTRFLVIDLKTLPDENIFIITGAIFMLTLCVLVLHIASTKFAIDEVRSKNAP